MDYFGLWLAGLSDVIQLLAEATLRPQITPDEVEGAKQAIHFELETLLMRPEQETILMDMIHAVSLSMNGKSTIWTSFF